MIKDLRDNFEFIVIVVLVLGAVHYLLKKFRGQGLK